MAEPEQRLSRAAAAERRRSGSRSGGVERDGDGVSARASACHELFEAQVERTPEAVAVVYEAEQAELRELNERANQLAHYLRALGVGPEVLVGLCVERSLEMVVALLGDPEGGRRVRAAGPGVSARAAGLHAARMRRCRWC